MIHVVLPTARAKAAPSALPPITPDAHPLRLHPQRPGATVIAVSVPASGTAADRRMRRRRLAKIVLLVATAVVWVPIAIVITLAKANAR